MEKCPTCGRVKSPSHILENLAEEYLPKGLELYDFGDGITTMPMSAPNGWLTTSIFYICQPQEKPKPWLFLGVSFDMKEGEQELRSKFISAVETFHSKAEPQAISGEIKYGS